MESTQVNTIALQKKLDVSYKNEVCEICELAAKHRIPAHFVELKREGPIHNATFTFKLTVGKFTAEAQGPTKIIAKNLAAQQILPDLRALPLRGKMLNRDTSSQKKLWRELPAFSPSANPIVVLHDILTNSRGKPAEYTVVHVDRSFEIWVFYVQLIVAEETVVGAGHSKKEAKRNAAIKLLNTFGYNFTLSEPENSKDEFLVVTDEKTTPDRALSEEEAQDDGHVEVTLKDTGLVPESDTSRTVEDFQTQETAQDDGHIEAVDIEASPVPESEIQALEAQLLSREDITSDVSREDTAGLAVMTQLEEQNQILPESSAMELFMERDSSVQWSEVAQRLKEPVSTIEREPSAPQENESNQEKKKNMTIITIVITMASVESPDSCNIINVDQPSAPFMEESTPVPGRSDQPTSSYEHLECNVLTNTCQPTAVVGEDRSSVPGRSDLPTSSCEYLPHETFTNAYQPEAPVGEDRSSVPRRSDQPTSSCEYLPPETFTNATAGGEDSDGPTSSNERPVAYILCNALVKEMFEMAGSQKTHEGNRMAIDLNYLVEEHLIVDRKCDYRFKDLQKIGKTAAKTMAQERGSPRELLKAAAEDYETFKWDVPRHLNAELGRFFRRRYRTSIPARFFFRLRKAFCFSQASKH